MVAQTPSSAQRQHMWVSKKRKKKKNLCPDEEEQTYRLFYQFYVVSLDSRIRNS
jgi:hypothetical protein